MHQLLSFESNTTPLTPTQSLLLQRSRGEMLQAGDWARHTQAFQHHLQQAPKTVSVPLRCRKRLRHAVSP